MRDGAGQADGVGRAAGRLGVVLRVRPQLERDRDRLAAGPVHQQRGDGRVDATAHGDERAAGLRRERGTRAGRAPERAMQRVRRQVRRMQLAGRQAAKLGGDLARADPRRVEHALALHQGHGGRAGGGERAAALGVEARGVHAVAGYAHGDADQVTASGAAGGAVEGPGKRATAPMGRGQMLGEALAIHER